MSCDNLVLTRSKIVETIATHNSILGGLMYVLSLNLENHGRRPAGEFRFVHAGVSWCHL